MPEISCEIEGVNVVLLGNFNPRIFQPAWFAHHGLIRIEEAEAAENVVVVPELATFKAAWLTLQVTLERFDASTADAAHFEALRDLVLGTFRLLEHTPFDKMGINRNMHYRVLPEERYVAFGHYLVPKTPWETVLQDPRTRSLTVEGLMTRETKAVKLTVKVEPSLRVPSGVFISTNEHYEAPGDDAGRRLMMQLEQYWDDAHSTAKRIAEHLLQQEY
ncbi:MAG: hypothetical protein HYS14_11075 [Candidatus Rokubacteria bacterium]|nr:hypothetical protein [Candidatus Rokubacteria bacterium]